MAKYTEITAPNYDAVNPPHYTRGPMLHIDIGDAGTRGMHTVAYPLQCIDVMRRIRDPRLATAFRYLWRVAFGGKTDPDFKLSQQDQDEKDIRKAIWYLTDWIENRVERATPSTSDGGILQNVRLEGDTIVITDTEGQIVAKHDRNSGYETST